MKRRAQAARCRAGRELKHHNGDMAVPIRAQIRPGLRVLVVEKQNQPTGELTEGVVARILTKSPKHPHGIKVMLADGRVGRVQSLCEPGM